MRSALVVCVLVAAAAGAAVAQPAPGPDEVVLLYLKAAFAPMDMSRRPPYPDAAYCRAYSLLSAQTRAVLSTVEFVASSRSMLFVLADVDLGEPRIEGEHAVVRARVVRVYALALNPRQQVDTQFFRLVRETPGWRIVLDEESVAGRKELARRYHGPQIGQQNPRVPETICD